MSAAIFLDKDGTLVEDLPYNVDPGKVRLAAGALDGLRALSECGYRIVVVTNQSGVARGLFDEDAVRAVGRHLAEVLASDGIALDGFYYCPHHPDGSIDRYRCDCDCRKPAPGLLHRAAEDLDVDLAASWMVGDIAADVEAGVAAGCRTALVNDAPELELRQMSRRPDIVARDLRQAVTGIIGLSTTPIGAPVQPS